MQERIIFPDKIPPNIITIGILNKAILTIKVSHIIFIKKGKTKQTTYYKIGCI